MMKIFSLSFLLLLIAGAVDVMAHGHSHSTAEGEFSFIKNKGQWKPSVEYKCVVPSGAIYFEKNRLVYDFLDYAPLHEAHASSANAVIPDKINGHCYYVYFEGALGNPQVAGASKQKTYHNYFLGNDSNRWAGRVPLYGELSYTEIYPGINFHATQSNGLLKFEFELAPGADANNIQLRYDGVDQIKVKNGELVIKTSLGQIIEEKPYAYQIIKGEEVLVPCFYKLEGKKLTYEFPNGYNKAHPLVIDPTLIFSSYSGSFGNNFGYTATYDSQGFLYAGSTIFGISGSYPTTTGAYQRSFQGGVSTLGGTDVAISKYDTNGSKFIYSTYLGGTANEMPHSLVVNSRDELYVMGTTSSRNFPTHTNAPQRTLKNPTTNNRHNMNGLGVDYTEGCDIFAIKFDVTGGQLRGGTYIGGSRNDGLNDTSTVNQMTLRYNYADEVRGEIDVDANDNVYIGSCTKSSDFPMIGNSYDTTFNGDQDGILIKMSNDLDTIIWTTFLGGAGKDAIYSLAIDKNLDIYVAGGTRSTDTANFPTGSLPGHVLNRGGRCEGFITHFANSGQLVINSTFFGTGAYDQIYFVELDRDDYPHVYGQTEDSTNYFIQNALYNKPRQGVFVSKLTPQLDSIWWSTTIGAHPPAATGESRPQLSPTAFLVDVCNSVYLSGWGGITNNASAPGGLTNNLSGNIIGLDTTTDAYQKTTDGSDFYFCSISDDASLLQYGSFYGGNLAREHVDGGTSRFDKKGIIYQSACAGCPNLTTGGPHSDFPIYPRGQVVSDSNRSGGCNNAVFKMDFKPPAVIAQFQLPPAICIKDSVQLINLSREHSSNSKYLWDFGNGVTSTLKEPKVFYDSVGTYRISLLITDSLSCNFVDSIFKNVLVESPVPSYLYRTDTICQGDTIMLGTAFNPNYEFSWSPGNTLDDSTKMRPNAFPLGTTTYQLLIQKDACLDTVFHHIRVDSLIIASLTAPDSICAPDSITFSNSGFETQNTSHLWLMTNVDTSTAATPTFVVPQRGIYQVFLIIEDSNSCNIRDTTVVGVLALEDTSYSLAPALNCNGDGTVLGIDSASGYTYQWVPTAHLDDPTSSSPVSNPPADQSYTLLVDRGVCTDTVDQLVQVDSILLTTTNDTDVCEVNKNVLLLANSFGLGILYQWSSDSNFTDTLNTSLLDSTIIANPSGFRTKYYVRSLSARGCLEEDTALIRINEYGIRTDSLVNICFGDTVQLFMSSAIPNDTLSVLWNPYQHIIGRNDTTHILVNPPADQTYVVRAENRIRCVIEDTVLVEVSSLNRASASVSSSVDTILINQVSVLTALPDGYAYSWTPVYNLSNPNSSQTEAGPDTTTTYTVEIFDPEYPQCRSLRSTQIVVEELLCEEPWLFIPNSFSPNGDGKNDVLYFRGRWISEFTMKIYNRWGQLVFETNDWNKGWDGFYNGELSQPDVYVYQLRAVCLDGQVFEKKGDVTLLK